MIHRRLRSANGIKKRFLGKRGGGGEGKLLQNYTKMLLLLLLLLHQTVRGCNMAHCGLLSSSHEETPFS